MGNVPRSPVQPGGAKPSSNSWSVTGSPHSTAPPVTAIPGLTAEAVAPTVGIKANEIWDAGSEVYDPAAAAFVGNNSLRTAQNSVFDMPVTK